MILTTLSICFHCGFGFVCQHLFHACINLIGRNACINLIGRNDRFAGIINTISSETSVSASSDFNNVINLFWLWLWLGVLTFGCVRAFLFRVHSQNPKFLVIVVSTLSERNI